MANFRFQGVVALVQRYVTTLRIAWAARAELETPPRLPHELAFLPAQLELLETPANPAAHWTIRTLGGLVLLVLVVAIFGKLDIVVTATGKVTPDTEVKIIQPALSGVVSEISIKNGQRVRAGQQLMKLDTTQAIADTKKADAARVDAALARARAQALLAAQRDGREPVFEAVAGAPDSRQQQAWQLAEGGYRAYRDKLGSMRAQLTKREAELDETRAEIAKLVATAPLARITANHYSALSGDGFVAKSDYLDKEQAALTQEHELTAQRSRARKLAAGVSEQRADIQLTASEFRRQQLDELEKSTQQLTQSSNDRVKAETRQALLELNAPVAGTVQQLSVHSVGAVVTAAQAVMKIVPDDALEIQATIDNKDIGFVKPGQRVAVKVEAFPYTRYGMLEGTIVDVSNDSFQDRKLGLAFAARIRLETNRIWVDNKWVGLTPGMTVTVEVKTGKRSVAGYFFGPLVEVGREGMRER